MTTKDKLTQDQAEKTELSNEDIALKDVIWENSKIICAPSTEKIVQKSSAFKETDSQSAIKPCDETIIKTHKALQTELAEAAKETSHTSLSTYLEESKDKVKALSKEAADVIADTANEIALYLRDKKDSAMVKTAEAAIKVSEKALELSDYISHKKEELEALTLEVKDKVSKSATEASEALKRNTEDFPAIVRAYSDVLDKAQRVRELDNIPRVAPRPGSVIYCDLAIAVEHSGIYCGGGWIIHRDGAGFLQKVKYEEFLKRLNGLNPASKIYVSCSEDHALYLPDVRTRAVEALHNPDFSGYQLFKQNCHHFTQYCISGNNEISYGIAHFTFSDLIDTLKRYTSFKRWGLWDHMEDE